jgi:hypothetical protein
MRMYAATPVRAARQVVADLLFVAWLAGWVWVALTVHDATLQLAGPGRQTEESATSLSERLREAGGSLGGLPVVGDEVSAPFDQAADASEGLASAGRAQVEAVEDLAFWLGLAVGGIPVLGVAAVYLPVRWRFVRRASAGQRFVDAQEDLDLFALRALAHQPMHVLARISDDPAGGWRRRDPQITRALAELELRADGLRPPRVGLAGGPAA